MIWTPHARPVLIVVVVWLLVASVFVAQNIVTALAAHRPLGWLPVVGYELEYWSVFALCTPYFAYMARRFSLDREWLRQSVVAQLVGGAAFALAQPVAADTLNYLTLVALSGSGDPRRVQFVTSATAHYPVLAIIALWKYAVVIGVLHAITYRHRLREHELRNAELKRQFAVAQLGALRMQLQPHFLFNSLHSAAILALREPERAHRFLAQLANLLRDMLRSTRREEVPLTEELEFLDRYLGIERVRFTDRLTVSYEVSVRAETAIVPSLLLQPLVENAIHHAIGQHSSARNLVLRAQVANGQLVIEVEDDGPGLPPEWTFESSAHTGLRNVQARVNLVNGRNTPLELCNRSPTGLCVRLTIPHRDAEVMAA
jgi:two-component system, LytTR family, sensor kinase